MEIKVSIIVPAYNVEKYIKRCLDSLINQTLKEIEIIVINDGSTDFTGNIVKDFLKKDNRIKYIEQENRGLAGARNRGLKEAQGKYINHLDGDDYIDKNYYEDMFRHAEESNLDVVVSNFIKESLYKAEIKQDFDIKGSATRFIMKSYDMLKVA
ncbi:MAG: glycosyltransferase family 2 protein [Fusobacteriaceae bacterium]